MRTQKHELIKCPECGSDQGDFKGHLIEDHGYSKYDAGKLIQQFKTASQNKRMESHSAWRGLEAKIPLQCTKITFTLESNNDMALTKAYEEVTKLLTDNFTPIVNFKVEMKN